MLLPLVVVSYLLKGKEISSPRSYKSTTRRTNLFERNLMLI
jgi:hypothetical protein